ncbi:MAG: type II toxin-antitoxin system VapC family toxin [Planctomycetota bacterium]|jgi:predicted nucleic acid-binding protein
MNVIVDTCIWSKALRRKNPDSRITENLTELIVEGRAVMIGPIRQEVLSGITERKQSLKLKRRLSAFKDYPIHTKHYELAAQYFNKCRENGIQGSHIDFLICAVATTENLCLYTTDNDFSHFSKYIRLHFHSQK